MISQTTRRNPYIIGRPIEEPQLIFGREPLFGFIEDNLRSNTKVILLHGQRRMGKSSVLLNIPNFVAKDEFVFVPFDLQVHCSKSLSSILNALVKEIIEQLEAQFNLDSQNIHLPSTIELENHSNIFLTKFLPQIYKILGDKKLVFLLDEFDSLTREESDLVVKNFFPYLSSISLEKRIFIIVFVGQKPEELPIILNVFEQAPVQEIGLLDELSAKRLITKPAQDVLEYEQDAIQAILQHSSGHPYFTQIICFALFGRARELDNWKVIREDVEDILDRAIELAEGGLTWFWEGLSIPERVVFSTVAEAQTIAISEKQPVLEEPLKLLKNYGIIETQELTQAREQLVSDGFLDDTGHKIKVDIIRHWLVKRHPLRLVIRELENLKQEKVNVLWESASELRQRGETQKELLIYEEILSPSLNPNHFSTIVALAQAYLDLEKFDKAVEMYTRAYKVDSLRYRNGLLAALQTSGQKSLAQRDFLSAKEYFHQILEIESDNQFARDKLQQIKSESEIKKPNYLNILSLNQPEIVSQKEKRITYRSKLAKNHLVSLTTITVLVGITTLVVGVYSQQLTSCVAGQSKVLSSKCEFDNTNISKFSRNLIDNGQNNNRKQGIEAFQQGKYVSAAEFFKKAKIANPKDPKILIYYNNALSQQQSSSLTLAVVVSVDNAPTTADEILQGVAQAQNQFNDRGGFNGRLLEVLLTNDENNQDKAKQIAQELVQDSSVLGVIGDMSSRTTSEALTVYEKANLATISPTSTSISLTGNTKVLFQTVPSQVATTKTLAKYALINLGLQKAVVLYNLDDSYSNSLRKEFTKNYEEIGGQVVQKINLSNTQLDVEKEILKSVYEHEAQAVLLFPDPTHTSLALKSVAFVSVTNAKFKSSNKQGFKEVKLLGGDTLYNSITLQKGKNNVEGLILVVPWLREASQSKDFAKAAEQEWGEKISWRTAASFDATQAFIEAFSSNTSRSTVLQRLREIKLPSSKTSGEILQFIPTGERQIEPMLVQVQKGIFAPVMQN